jgi:hypothetical protein
MSGCNDNLEDGTEVVDTPQGEIIKMKKIMSLMLGLSLVLGTVSLFADDAKTTDTKSTKAPKAKGTKKSTKKSTDTKKTTS